MKYKISVSHKKNCCDQNLFPSFFWNIELKGRIGEFQGERNSLKYNKACLHCRGLTNTTATISTISRKIFVPIINNKKP